MSLLDKMNEVISQREDNHDNPLPNFLRIALLWSVWYNKVFTPLDVIFMMDLLKTAREIHNHLDDTLLDKTGYTVSCYERIDAAMKLLDYEGIEYFRKQVEFFKDPTFTEASGNSYVFGMLYRILGEWKAFEAQQIKSNTGLLQ